MPFCLRDLSVPVKPGKKERKSFAVEENTVVVLPLVSKSPHENGFASFGKILVDVLADCSDLSVINIPEFISGARGRISSERFDMASLKSYAERREVSLIEMEKGVVIY